MMTLYSLSWFYALPTALQGYLGIAIFASTIFIIQMVMSFIGTGDVDTGAADVDVDFDTDVDIDANSDSPDALDDAGSLHLLSIRNVVYFLLGFGWTGVSLWNTFQDKTILLIVALLVGIGFVALFMFLFSQMLKLQHNGNYDINDTVGKVCDVYMRIPAAGSGLGKVQISISGSVHEFGARTEHPEMLPSGSKVQVIKVIDKNILVVEPV